MKGINYDLEQINKYTAVWSYLEASGFAFTSCSLQHKLLDPFQTAFCRQAMHKLDPSNLQIEILILMTAPWIFSVCLQRKSFNLALEPSRKSFAVAPLKLSKI